MNNNFVRSKIEISLTYWVHVFWEVLLFICLCSMFDKGFESEEMKELPRPGVGMFTVVLLIRICHFVCCSFLHLQFLPLLFFWGWNRIWQWAWSEVQFSLYIFFCSACVRQSQFHAHFHHLFLIAYGSTPMSMIISAQQQEATDSRCYYLHQTT